MFDKNLKKIMEQKGITSAALARKAGFSKGAVSQWRNGIYTPSSENIAILADALECSVEDLTAGEKGVAVTVEPGKAYIKDAKLTLTTKEVATLMHKHESYVRQGLQEGRPGFEFGSAVKTSGKWSYFISVAKFTEVTGIPVNI